MIKPCALAMLVLFPLQADAAPWCPISSNDTLKLVGPVVQEIQPIMNRRPAPVVHVHTEGTLPGKGIRDESLVAEKQLPIIRDAALAWRSGAGDTYLAFAERGLNAWVTTYQPDFNPIDETPFDALIETYAVISSKMTVASRTASSTFFHNWATGYVRAMDRAARARQKGRWTNNWQSHRIKLVTMMAVALGDPQLLSDARRLFKNQLAANIKADGEVIDFNERDALHYVIYDLEPLTRAALAARTTGEDWFNMRNSSGSSLAAAFKWLEPFANGAKSHQEFLHSKVGFDAKRAAAGEKGYAGAFDPKTAGDAFWLASLFDPQYQSLAGRLKPNPPTFVALCGA